MSISKNFVTALSLLALFISLAPTALGISISYGTNGVSSSDNYNLNDRTSLHGATTLGEGLLFQKSQVSGSGDNKVSQHVSGGSYNAGNDLDVSKSDRFDASTYTMASSQSAIKSLDLEGQGNIVASVSGVAGSASTGQEAAVLNGDVATSQNVATGDKFSTSAQNTGITGDAGAIASKSFSTGNNMALVGGFSSSGDLRTELTSIAADKAAIYGSASMLGQECVGNNVLENVASNGLAMEADGIYSDSKGHLGTYGLTAMNVVNQGQSGIGYQAAGWRWANNPQIHILLSGPTVSNPASVAQEISKAANTWDQNTGQNLFRGTDTANTPGSANAVEITSQIPAFGNNRMARIYMHGPALSRSPS
jgi:hypothetical protein